MADRLRVFRGKGAFDRAVEARAEGQTICSCDADPVKREVAYFLMAKDASDADVRDAAFFIRHGRQIGVERQMLDMADRLKARGL